jgi:hypothetical protein
MRQVSDGFLLQVAEISATLIGLFLVGVFFYVETGLRRLSPDSRAVFVPYFRSATRIVLVLYALPLFLSLTLVALTLGWNRWLFLLLSVVLVTANVSSLARVRGIRSPTLVVNELVGTAVVAVLVLLPWALGGLHPTREELTLAILLSFGSGFLSVSALVLSILDAAEGEAGPARGRVLR